MSYVYLIHFEQEIGSPTNPRGRAGHYLGYTGSSSLKKRMIRHSNGSGARILQVLKEKGIGWKVVRTWKGSRSLERRLKNRHKSSVFCPICSPRTYKENGKDNISP